MEAIDIGIRIFGPKFAQFMGDRPSEQNEQEAPPIDDEEIRVDPRIDISTLDGTDIRDADMPERYQVEPFQAMQRASGDIEGEARWITDKLFQEKKFDSTQAEVVPAVKNVLDFLTGYQHLTVPFVSAYKKDYFAEFLEDDDLWKIQDHHCEYMDIRYNKLEAEKVLNSFINAGEQDTSLLALDTETPTLRQQAYDDDVQEAGAYLRKIDKIRSKTAAVDLLFFIKMRFVLPSRKRKKSRPSRRDVYEVRAIGPLIDVHKMRLNMQKRI